MRFWFLDLDAFEIIHEAVCESVDEPSDGVYNTALLDGAISAPKNFALYTPNVDAFDIAARYVYHVACDHPFTNGNKRTALMAALYFLWKNALAKPDSGTWVLQVFNELPDMIRDLVAANDRKKREVLTVVLAAELRKHYGFLML